MQNNGFHCARCGAHVQLGMTYFRNRWDRPTGKRCSKCGAMHGVLRGEASVIHPPMKPIDTPGTNRSPWMPWYSRPVEAGVYECNFSDAGVLRLYWNTHNFAVLDGPCVSLRTLLGWRGGWL